MCPIPQSTSKQHCLRIENVAFRLVPQLVGILVLKSYSKCDLHSPLTHNDSTVQHKSVSVYAICCRPEVGVDVISGENVKRGLCCVNLDAVELGCVAYCVERFTQPHRLAGFLILIHDKIP